MIYAYYRVSTQTQAERNSTSMQIDVVTKYAETNGIEIADSFSDEGVSGTILERPGMMDLINILEPGDKIIVQNTSRLWRDLYVQALLMKEIEKAGCDVISVEQPNYSIYVKDPNDILINGMMELLDRYEKAQISMKLYKGRKAKSYKGDKPCGVAPYGYKWDNANIVIDYNNNLVVQDIFLQYTLCKSLSTLEEICNAKGYRTNRGCKFSKKTLANILHNDFYIGYVTYAGSKKMGNHKPIIEQDLFNQVQAIMER